MRLTENTVLITGGASGIGLALAERFSKAGNKVIVCGRRKAKLSEAKKRIPGIDTYAVDLSDPQARIDLAQWAQKELPDLNVLVNNAGIQRYPHLLKAESWLKTHAEIAINLEAPIHLATLIANQVIMAKNPAIINVTSGLSFSPIARAPVYCATKAALHSFTLSLRHQLRQSRIQVIEIIPPAVDTDLGGPGLHIFGVNVDEFADHAFKELARGELEIAYGFADEAKRASPEDLKKIFARMNSA